jgi:hypothetical protein
MSYRWQSPLAWLRWKIDELTIGNNIIALSTMFIVLAITLDNDQIQDVFERDMDKDGYFEEES